MFSRTFLASLTAIALVAGVQMYRSAGAADPPRGMQLVTADPRTMAPEEYHRWRDLDDCGARRARFREFEQRVLTQLERRELSLQDTVNTVFYYSLYQYPEFLSNVAVVEQGDTIKVKVARHLVRGYHMWNTGRDQRPFLEQLDAELRELVCAEGVATSTNVQ
jgi:hypothetical protein